MRVRTLVTFLFIVSTNLYSQKTFSPAIDTKRPALPFIQQKSNDDSIVQVIVEFNDEPMFLAQQHSFAKISASSYLDRFDQFESDVRGILSRTAFSKSQFSNTGKRFYKIFFGMGIHLSQGMIPMIEQLSYVKKIHHNKLVKASIEKSVQQIRANEVWANTGLKGDGIVVGIIDSGIDYLHPALGGGIGSTFKVIGGYDFVNSDNDPMDDNGHGTHVAGIVAANAANIQGVAPNAKLYALKVLDNEGGGSFENIIAAIELTVDPNDDGAMNDKLDIVNMSLGSRDGDPDDAASIAVDNATKLGVTFVIAAGNDGHSELISGKENNYYYNGSETIGSPGTSRLAITVGAIDSVNKLAYFSSKGPTRKYFGIKPEVVAPGVNIRSTFPGNSYLIESGTSMAAPMIAGVAALLKSKNNTLTPAQIKSAIVNSSVDLGLKIMHQGAGRVDAMRAVSNATFAEPTQLSFGLDNPAQATWTKVETVTVLNGKNVSQNYSVAFGGSVSGITLSSSPQNFSLAAGAEQKVMITVSVNNNIIPIVNEDIILHAGFAHINGTTDTLHLPWSFARTTRMLLSFSEPDVQFVGSSFTYYITALYNKFYSRVRWLDPHNLEVTGAFNETYDFAVHFPNSSRIVIKEELPFNGSGTFTFNAAEAIHAVHFDGVDNNNVPLSTFGKTQRSLRVNMPNGFVFATLPKGIKTIHVTPASNRFNFVGVEALIDLQTSKKIFLPHYVPFTGMSGTVHLTNSPTAYYSQTMKFSFAPNVPKTRIFSDIITVDTEFGEHYYNTILLGVDTVDIQNHELSFDLYLTKPVDEKQSTSISFHTNDSYLDDYFLDLSTRYFFVVNDSIMPGFPLQNSVASYKSANGGTMRFGESPIHIMNLSYNNSFGTSIHFNPLFRGGLQELRYKDVYFGKYTIYNSSGVKIKEEVLDLFPRYPFETAAGKYRLELEANNHYVKNAKGKITLINDVDLTKEIADAPYITSFILLDANKRSANMFVKNEQATLRFSSKIYYFPNQLPVSDSTKVYYRKYKTSQWIPLSVTKIADELEKEGSAFSASLAPATSEDSVAIDLKIRIVDQTGNATEQILSPAFSVGNWMDDGTAPVEEGKNIVPTDFALLQNYPNPFNPFTTIAYQLPTGGNVSLKVYDALGREVALLVNETKEAGSYNVQFNASKLASGIYFYRLTAGNNTALKKMILLK